MRGTGDDWSIALAVAAVIAGSVGIIGDSTTFTTVAWVLLVAALVAIAADTVTPEMTLASCATGVVLVGCAGTFAGFMIGSDLIAYGALSVCVLGFVVAVGEMWGAS